jgi:hypothetical protein
MEVAVIKFTDTSKVEKQHEIFSGRLKKNKH